MTGDTFLLYSRVVDSSSGVRRPVVLLVDQHPSRFSVEALKFAQERDIIIIAFPANATFILQPLDVSTFSFFKRCLTHNFNDV